MIQHKNNCQITHTRVSNTTLYFGQYRYCLRVPGRHVFEFVGVRKSYWNVASAAHYMSADLSQEFIQQLEHDADRMQHWLDSNKSTVKSTVSSAVAMNDNCKINLYSNHLDVLMQFVDILPAHALEQQLPNRLILAQEPVRQVNLTEVVDEPVSYLPGAVKKRKSDYNYLITLRAVAEVFDFSNGQDSLSKKTTLILNALSDLHRTGEICVIDVNKGGRRATDTDFGFAWMLQQLAWVGLPVECKNESTVSLLTLQFPGMIKTVKPIIVVAPTVVQTEIING